MKPLLILDTSMLFAPFTYSFNLDAAVQNFLGSVEIVVPSSVIKELEGLEKTERIAKTVLRFAEKYKRVEVEQRGDRGIIECASKFVEREVYVATLDSRLAEKLVKKGYRVVFLREGQKLALRER
ncbi:MAG: PIN domain-containing protein [Thermoplasmata archaeon]|nr:PIN domain-containing protein [Thermoplasmata archaeon]